MKIRYYFIGLFFISYFASIFEVKSSTHNIDLINQIKPNPTTSSKPTSDFIKLASVQFLGNTRKELNYGCPEGQGWSITEDGCVVNPCEGYHYVSNSPQLGMCTSTSTCLSGTVLKYKCEGCISEYNLKLDNGRCLCDTATYPHNNLNNPCPEDGAVLDEENVCKEINNEGALVTYYRGCVCPEGWKECNKEHLLEGVGQACTALEGKVKYSSCKCPSGYDELCEDKNERGDGSYCKLNGVYFYQSCKVCDPDKGQLYDENKYWCGIGLDDWSPWVEVQDIKSSYINLELGE